MFENDVVFKICPFTKKMYQTTYVYLYHWAAQVVWSWFCKVKQLPGQAATYPLAATCSHLQFQAATCSYKRPLAATSSHLQLQAATCSYTLPFAWATTCSHWQPEAATCCHWQVAGSCRFFENQIAHLLGPRSHFTWYSSTLIRYKLVFDST